MEGFLMKLDFDSIFNAKPLSEMEVQDVVLRELNKDLPSDDIEYASLLKMVFVILLLNQIN